MPPISPRTVPRQERSRFTVSVILEATERLLGRAEKLSTRGIARLAGVSVGTLYQYFPAKEAAVAAVIDRRLAEDERRMLEVFERNREKTLATLVRSALEQMVPCSDWERALYPAMVDTLESLGRLQAVKRVLARFEQLLGDEFERRSHELSPGLAPRVAATIIVHTQRAALLSLAQGHPDLPREEIIAELERLCLTYLEGSSDLDGSSAPCLSMRHSSYP